MQRSTKVALALGVSAVVIAACDPTSSPLTTAPPATLALSNSSDNPQGYPTDDWVYLPASLDPDYQKYECTFALGNGASRNADSACQEKQWGKSGIYREQARHLHAVSLPDCAGGPGDFDVIRICNLEWPKGFVTPWGVVGGAHCTAATLTATCTV